MTNEEEEEEEAAETEQMRIGERKMSEGKGKDK